MAHVTYDTGALVAAQRNERAMWALHAGFLAEEVAPTVPAPVLAEAWRGGARQASLSRLLASCVVEEMTEDQAHRVGALAGRARHEDIVDVTVVAGAARRRDAIVRPTTRTYERSPKQHVHDSKSNTSDRERTRGAARRCAVRTVIAIRVRDKVRVGGPSRRPVTYGPTHLVATR